MSSRSLMCILIFVPLWAAVSADIMEVYNTRLATSDLLWTKHSNSPAQGWEEVSSFSRDYMNTIRSYQVCRQEDDEEEEEELDVSSESNDVNNWIRSPYISTRGGKRIHLDVEFSISKCSADISGKKSAKCKETFNLFYYEADSAVASSTFPPWHEKPYVKIDTVAANEVGGLNKKTFNFSPKRSGFYIAVQDQGACMSLISLHIYYFYCHETTEKLAVFPKTISDAGLTSLVIVDGTCVENAEPASTDKTEYHCSSDGRWQVTKGGCKCQAGHRPNIQNTECLACPAGSYSLRSGSRDCIPCPRNSGLYQSTSTSSTTEVDRMIIEHNECPCFPGYARAPDEDISVACTKPPSQPLSLNVSDITATSVTLRWQHPEYNGGRKDLFYSFECQTSEVFSTQWKGCSKSLSYTAPTRGGRFYENYLTVMHLTPYTKYKFYVHAKNGASDAAGRLTLTNTGVSGIELETLESVPSAVNDVRVTSRLSSSVTIKWSLPDQPNGVITGYEVELVPKTKVHGPRPASVSAPDVRKTAESSITFSGLQVNSEYQVRVRAMTSAGNGVYNQPSTFYTASKPDAGPDAASSNVVVIIAVICAVVFAVLLLVVGVRYKRTGKLLCLATDRVERKKKNTAVPNGNAHADRMLQERLIVDLPPPDQRIYVDYPDPAAAIARFGREINIRDIKVEEVIGKGEFAEVCRGKLSVKSRQEDVAVKKLKAGATKKDQQNFLREASTIAQFNDPNVVQLKGVVTRSSQVMIVTEYMENGSLDQYLRRSKDQLRIVQLATMLKGIASGMRYLSRMKYVHRDLAARNILVNSELVCKVSDFGLSRTLENDPHATYTTQGGKIAVRWTALECIHYRQFTTASDVWSYGIVMWEVMSYGEKPYWDMSNEDVVKNLDQGMRLPSPSDCPKALHDTMVECWLSDPKLRPTFVDLVQKIERLLQQPDLLHPNTQQDSKDIATPNISRAISNGEVENVDQWLEIQKLSKYKEQFHQRGIDSLDKVCDLTINDLKSFGIDVTFHINKLENGIRTLKHHLSTCSSPPSSCRTSAASTVLQEEPESSGPMIHGGVIV
ncbi:unnamed protein product [Clavelina lepadiformis]|uniref:receptor protein-tyrosine kinase n=1 Tax=Clavelina lepadiformis TaxID=159417 RepID=A0ABP0GJ42_CLALP